MLVILCFQVLLVQISVVLSPRFSVGVKVSLYCSLHTQCTYRVQCNSSLHIS